MIQGIYILFSMALAYYNYRRILYDKRIFHGVNGLLHLAFWLGVFLFTKSWFPVVVLPFIGRLFFDSGLNLMRNLPLGYVPRKPKSIVDKIEKWLFGMDGIAPKFIYTIIIITLNIVYAVNN